MNNDMPVMNDQLQESIADEMSVKRRRAVLDKLAQNLATEDLELIADVAPCALDFAMHEILNPPEE